MAASFPLVTGTLCLLAFTACDSAETEATEATEALRQKMAEIAELERKLADLERAGAVDDLDSRARDADDDDDGGGADAPSGAARTGRTVQGSIPPGMFAVTPARRDEPAPAPRDAGKPPEVRRGQHFDYVLPDGWRLQEDGQYALTMVAADNKAITLMVGNSGLMPDAEPARFVYEKLSALQPEDLRLHSARASDPLPGFQSAIVFAVTYKVAGQPCEGIAKCHVAPYYGGVTMAMTAALADATQWPSYRAWLPWVAEQISAHSGAAFGMRGVMQQNLRESIAQGEAARQYREWSQRNWQGVVDHRNQVQDRQQHEFRENLGAIRTYANPFDDRVPVELSTQYEHYWVNRQGEILGTDDARIDPNHGSTGEWQRMQRR